MDQKEMAKLMSRVKTGTATPEEIQKLENFWLDGHRSDAYLKDHVPEELDSIGNTMYDRIEATIHKGKLRRMPLWSNPVVFRAAALLMVLITASVWFYANRNSMTEVRTGFGQRRTVTLPDQSSVVLNGNSMLRYSASWEEDAPREVWIEGEGFFSVTHTQNHQQFIVHSDQLNVEVLGTKFNVKARPCISEVMLAEGRVKLGLTGNAQTAAMFLKPGEVATMKDRGLSKREARKEQFTSWIENKMYFDKTPLRDIARILNETYGLEVRFANPGLEKRELSGEISSATEDDILLAITETFNLKYVKDGRSVTISQKAIGE